MENSNIDNSKVIFHNNFTEPVKGKDKKLIKQFNELVNHPLNKKDIEIIISLLRYSEKKSIPSIINKIDLVSSDTLFEKNIVEDFLKCFDQFKSYLEKHNKHIDKEDNNIERTI